MNASEPYAPEPAFRAALPVNGAGERGLVLDPVDAKALGIGLLRASIEGQVVRLELPAQFAPDAERRTPGFDGT